MVRQPNSRSQKLSPEEIFLFVDNVKIAVKAGAGGKGAYSFYKDKYWRYKKPDGGDGGRGGNVIVRADKNFYTLYDFRYRQHFTAEKGGQGMSNRKKGRDGQDKIIVVPLGTLTIDSRTNCRLRELLEDSQEFIAARGGEGGKGSVHAKLEQELQGAPGEEKELILDLRLIADAGLIGFPNSGKSTLISKISNAHPKIAGYPFTTKEPVLGIVSREGAAFSVADIPGLIKDSHLGKGLGDRFLRHIERTKVLVHLMDMAGVDGRSPFEDYRVIKKELQSYSEEVFKKPVILVANKMDLPQAKENLALFKQKVKEMVISISALESQGLDRLLNAIQKKLLAHSS
ncbi:MAG: hypothetical protein A3J51_01410 [Omnitrophica WOR_2 bacterium RIFCSPHIGHO2_02_FULL_45_21]|nr:MAG: hypothetical protein A3J51_01410 [Omnitrophica WOR_2 bacterium RIFCSPHIGHO2_02_FULL_45_21]